MRSPSIIDETRDRLHEICVVLTATCTSESTTSGVLSTRYDLAGCLQPMQERAAAACRRDYDGAGGKLAPRAEWIRRRLRIVRGPRPTQTHSTARHSNSSFMNAMLVQCIRRSNATTGCPRNILPRRQEHPAPLARIHSSLTDPTTYLGTVSHQAQPPTPYLHLTDSW